MAKDSYDIDDILSEIKEHKVKQNKSFEVDKEYAKTPQKSAQTKKKIDHKGDVKVGLYEIIDQAEKAEKAVKAEKAKEQEEKFRNINFDTEDLSFNDSPDTTEKVETENMSFDESNVPEKETEDTSSLMFNDIEDSQEEVEKELNFDSVINDDDLIDKETENSTETELSFDKDSDIPADSNSNESVDEYSMADVLAVRQNFGKSETDEEKMTTESEPKKEKKVKKQDTKEDKKQDKFRKTKRGKIVISIMCILLALIIATTGWGAWYINDKLNNVVDTDESTSDVVTSFTGMDKLVEKFDLIYEDDAYSVSSYKDMAKKWYLNGTPCSSTHVLNILLVGQDTTDTKSTSRADSAIIASINIDTKTITLTSILRDTYVYWQNDGKDAYNKITEVCSIGGMGAYITTVENTYKVEIDNYVTVNFDTFPKIIDKLGGLTIDMTEREINEINSHPKRYLYPDTINYDSSKLTYNEETSTYTVPVKCNGGQALAFSRIRKIDSDNQRANRQKTVLLLLFNKAKEASNKELLSTVTTLMGYVKTGYSKSDIVSIGKYALVNGWLSYQTATQTIPSEDCSVGGSSSSFFNTWCWKADFPMDSYNLQMSVYGKSNVVLAETRPNFATISAY